MRFCGYSYKIQLLGLIVYQYYWDYTNMHMSYYICMHAAVDFSTLACNRKLHNTKTTSCNMAHAAVQKQFTQ